MIKLSRQQEKALSRIKQFLQGNESKIFILKGYAGTGKTTLIQRLVSQLDHAQKSFEVMAPTGRAAKILRDKTRNIEHNREGYGSTIHRAIYNYEDLEIIEDEEHSTEGLSYKYYFPIKKIERSRHLIIVDEASMVSEKENKQELYQSGTDRLLPDLLTYTGFSKTNKILFIGDPAQLPPVGENESKALSERYFNDNGIKVDSYELTEVIRQTSHSTILKNSVKIRELLDKGKNERNTLKFDYDRDFVKVDEVDLLSVYLDDNPSPGLDNGVIINYKNRDCLSYNREIRKHYFPNKESLEAGDILLNTKNVYGTFGAYLYNGDLVQVVDVDEETQTQSARIYVEEEGKRVKKLFSFRFRTVAIITQDHTDPIQVKIIDSMLEEPEGALSTDQMRALFVNFVIRFEEEQKIRNNQGLPHYSRNSEVYKEMLNSDPFFNALHVKYGYSITCHKAQGGEWSTAYVNFKGKTGLSDENLRWTYTALTRGKKMLYAMNAHDHSPFTNIKFLLISQLKNIPNDVLSFGDPPATPYHGVDSHPAKRVLYFEIQKKIKNTDFSLKRVDSSSYQEMYYVQDSNQEVRLDTTHNAAGLFKPFKLVNGDEENSAELIELFNKPFNKNFKVTYSPSTDVLNKLYDKIKNVLSETDGELAGVLEKPSNYYVVYYFYIKGAFASLKFNFKSNGMISSAEPKITDMRKRDLLLPLIDQLQ